MTLAVNIAQSGSNNVSFRNRVINGACVIDQRNSGASVTPADGAYLVDRFAYGSSQASKFTAQQNAGSVTPPVGFSNYLGFTVASAVTVGAGDYFYFYQRIEGFNTYDLAWGTANAKTVTLSFQVYSSLTGTFGGVIQNAANNRSYPFTYTISSANTWTSISVTIAGDTSGTWVGATNATGLQIRWGLGVGSTYSGTAGAWAGSNLVSATGAVSVVGTASATFYITGVQLEAGTTASPFENRSYTIEQQLCLRYYLHIYMAAGNVHYMLMLMPTNPGTSNFGFIPLTTTMRLTVPVFVLYPAYNTGSSWNLNNAIVNQPFTGVPTIVSGSAGISPSSIGINVQVSTAMNLGYPTFFYNNTGTNGYIALNAEL